jgi:glycosyltransferase involved in cell wall biosynthesis
LIDAWREQGGAPLAIVGGGPAEAALRERARGVAGVRFLGALPRDAVLRELRAAAFAVVPSRWYENAPYAAIEALASARPVVAWRGGAPPSSWEMGIPGGLTRSTPRASRARAHSYRLGKRSAGRAGAREDYSRATRPKPGSRCAALRRGRRGGGESPAAGRPRA